MRGQKSFYNLTTLLLKAENLCAGDERRAGIAVSWVGRAPVNLSAKFICVH